MIFSVISNIFFIWCLVGLTPQKRITLIFNVVKDWFLLEFVSKSATSYSTLDFAQFDYY